MDKNLEVTPLSEIWTKLAKAAILKSVFLFTIYDDLKENLQHLSDHCDLITNLPVQAEIATLFQVQDRDDYYYKVHMLKSSGCFIQAVCHSLQPFMINSVDEKTSNLTIQILLHQMFADLKHLKLDQTLSNLQDGSGPSNRLEELPTNDPALNYIGGVVYHDLHEKFKLNNYCYLFFDNVLKEKPDGDVDYDKDEIWTMMKDRGGLMFTSKIAWDFVKLVNSIVKPIYQPHLKTPTLRATSLERLNSSNAVEEMWMKLWGCNSGSGKGLANYLRTCYENKKAESSTGKKGIRTSLKRKCPV